MYSEKKKFKQIKSGGNGARKRMGTEVWSQTEKVGGKKL